MQVMPMLKMVSSIKYLSVNHRDSKYNLQVLNQQFSSHCLEQILAIELNHI